MPLFFYVACDGGHLNTLAGGGGILEIMLKPEFRTRYYEFPDGMGGSTHMVLPTPDKRALVASCANIGQVFVIPRGKGSFDFEDYRLINNFNSVGTPEVGHDSQSAMFDFLDNEHIIVHYNRKLIKVNIETAALEVLADIAQVGHQAAGVVHQISVTDKYILTNNGALFVYNRATKNVFTMGDGFLGGHFLVVEDENKDTIVIRPSFNINKLDGHLKFDDNTMTFYNVDKRTVKTFYYSWEEPNHLPTEMAKEDGFLYINYAIPGSVSKIDLRTGRSIARFSRRPWIGTRYASMLLDLLGFLLDYGTFQNRVENTRTTINQLAHSYKMGALAGTRAGFFAMGFTPEADEFYVCHRGLNTVYCLEKATLQERWSRRLPGRTINSPVMSAIYRNFPYFRNCLGLHHGDLVEIDDSAPLGASGTDVSSA
jgi:hypothetical protein